MAVACLVLLWAFHTGAARRIADKVHTDKTAPTLDTLDVRGSADGICPPEFPEFQASTDFLTGDRCANTADPAKPPYVRCPKGCFAVFVKNDDSNSMEMAMPWCVDGERQPCRSTECWTIHKNFKDMSSLHFMGNYCEADKDVKAIPWCEPYACEVADPRAAPYTGDMSSSRRRGLPSKGLKWPPCRVTEAGTKAKVKVGKTKSMAIARWELVASSTHGLEATVEIGMETATGKQVTETDMREFDESLSTSVGVEVAGYSVSVEGSLSKAHQFGVEKTVESVKSRWEAQALTVSCPETTNWVKTAKIPPTSPTATTTILDYMREDPVATESLFQWVVEANGVRARTEHFRCHTAEDGKLRHPECPPMNCGSPVDNPFCEKSKCIKDDAALK